MLKPLNTKIDTSHYQLLRRLHKTSAIPMSKIIERSLEMFAVHLKDINRGVSLLRDIEDAHKEYERGEVYDMSDLEDVLKKAEKKK